MKTLLLAAIITCYSPSDCVSPQYCSSERDGVIPGRCLDEFKEEPQEREPNPIGPIILEPVEIQELPPPPISSAPTVKTISDPLPEKLAPVATESSSSEESSSVESSEESSEKTETEELPEEEPAGIVQTFKNIWCFFFCK